MRHIQTFENFLGEDAVEEMAIGDVRVQAILAAFDTAEKVEKEKIAEIVTGNKKSDRKKLIDELAEIGYNDIKELVDELEINVLEGAPKATPEIKESKDVNEGLNQGQARQLSHTILNKMVDLDIMKPKQKTEDLLELITSLIMNSK